MTAPKPPTMATVHDCSKTAPDLGGSNGQQVLEGQSFTCPSCNRVWVSELQMDRGSAPKAKWVSTKAPQSTTTTASAVVSGAVKVTK